MKRERLNIGLFVSNVDDPFDNAIVKGAMQGARELDANLIIFPGRYLKGIFFDKERTRDAYQYNTLFSYATEEHIDVLLISLGTVATTLNDNEKKIFLDMYHDIPVMLIASNFKGYPSVNFNNSTGLRDGINDLIENKGCTKIGFVSGPMTNMDAVERLKVYKDCLESHKIEVIEDRIVYGNFSQYCTDEVETLLGNDPELEAIVFANDAMAIGGYSVLKKHGRCIGSDIYVLGFDDSPCATTLIPNLSSVRADAVELGRRGAIEAVNYKMTGEAKKVYIDTSFIKRNSTGNEDDDTIDELDACGLRRCLSGDMSAAAKLIVSKISPRSGGDRDYQQFVGISCEFVKGFLEQIRDNDDSNATIEKMGFLLERGFNSQVGKNLELRIVFNFFDVFKNICNRYYPQNSGLVSDLIYVYLGRITMILVSKKADKEHLRDELTYISNSVTRDMLYYGEDDDVSYSTVVDKLTLLGFKSGFLYANTAPFINYNPEAWHDWQIPATTMLKSYFVRPDEIKIVDPNNQFINSLDVYDNQYMPNDRRYDLMIHNIFINEEQMGVMVCELDMEQISFMTSIVAQISSAYKIIYMLRAQSGIQKQLEASLQKIKDSNQILETISKTDELTGIYNRRGFFDTANSMIKNPKNKNKKAILIFADMDNLKIVNDKYGHDDGDFSLRSVADILKDSMRASDVVARIGGDEFAAIALSEKDVDPMVICNRIKTICTKFNVQCEKPYYIGISVGYAEFDCGENVEIEGYLDQADERLYENKKYKLKDITKK